MGNGILTILIVIGAIIALGIKVVPQQEAWIIERLGKFNKTLQPGFNVIFPIIDRVAYKHSLKEKAIDVLEQAAITRDNVTLLLDGILYLRIINPIDASYGVENPQYAVSQLAQTSMRSAIGKMPLDRTFEERETLNNQIVEAINDAASTWGIQCMRYEIKDIKPPSTVLKAMELQVAADRQKRAEILESEGKQQAQINLAEANKRSVVLASEAAMTDKINRAKGDADALIKVAEADKRKTVLESEAALVDQVNRAKGEAEAIVEVAKATGDGIEMVGNKAIKSGGSEAISYKIAENYVQAFEKLAKSSSTIVVPANSNDTASMVTQALSIFKSINDTKR